jgi:hypothetical protein
MGRYGNRLSPRGSFAAGGIDRITGQAAVLVRLSTWRVTPPSTIPA